MVSKRKFSVPKNLAQVADLLYVTRQRRLEIQKQAEELQDQETQLKTALIEQLPKGEATGIAGKVARVAVLMKVGAEVTDVEKLKTYLKKSDRWDLVYALRPAERAVKEMWEAGKSVPGIDPKEYPFVSINKL